MKEFIRLATKWKYTWQAWGMNFFYLLVWASVSDEVKLKVLFCLLCVNLAAFLMAGGKWWGSLFGALYGALPSIEYFYYRYLMNYSFLNSPVLTTGIIVTYYFFIGRICYDENKKQG